MNISEIRLFNILRKKLGEEESDSIVEFVHAEINAEMERKSDIFLTKDDKGELLSKINEVQINLIDRMNKNKTETLAWIVGTGVLQFLMVLLFKKL